MLDLLLASEEFVEPKAFGVISPGVAVACAMLAVFAIMWRAGLPGMIARALDDRIDAIRKQLDEAAKLREEALALKASYEKKMQAADGEIAELKAQAERQAGEIVAQAKVDAENMVERRTQLAEEKIAAAERNAVEELRAKAATAAAVASRQLIAKEHGESEDRELADKIIADL